MQSADVERRYRQYLQDVRNGGDRYPSTRAAARKQAWTGWGPAQFPKRHVVAGWGWDDHLNGFLTTAQRDFECSCGEVHPVPGYKTCKCGKIWNSYGIGSGGDIKTASPEKFIAREIPVREGVVMASRRTADGGPGNSSEDLDGSVSYYDPTERERIREQHRGRKPWEASRRQAEDASADYVLNGFEDWLMTQGTSLEAVKQDPGQFETMLREYMGRSGDTASVGEVMQRAAFKWRNPVPQGNGINIEMIDGPGWNASVHPNGSWSISRGDATPLLNGRAGGPVEGKGIVEEHLRRVKAPLHQATSGPTVGGGSIGKTPGGPQGPGTEGLKQRTRYRNHTTPQLRNLRQRMLNQNGGGVDMSELLRELGFREIIGAIHDLTEPGQLADGKRTKRTDPSFATPADWAKRNEVGQWIRSDGHS